MALSPLLTPRTYYQETIINTGPVVNDQQTSVNLGLKVLQQVEVLWPPGQVGLVGVALSLDGVWLVPWNQTGQFVFDSQNRRTWDIGMLLDHPVIVHTHNSGRTAHQTFVTFAYTDPELQGDTTVSAPLPVLSLQ